MLGLYLVLAHFSFVCVHVVSFLSHSEGTIPTEARIGFPGSFPYVYLSALVLLVIRKEGYSLKLGLGRFWPISHLFICARYLFFSHSEGRIPTEYRVGIFGSFHICLSLRIIQFLAI